MKKLQVILVTGVMALFLGSGGVFAGDLDDGISKFTDDGISKYDDLGKADKNITFIVMNAKSQAAVKKNSQGGDATKSQSGDANMNSVVLGAGSKVKGDIYIIDQSKGPKTNVAD